MAIMTRMLCMNCNKKPASPDSHYCGKRCSNAFVKRNQGPVQCEGGFYRGCSAACDTVAEAKANGWTDIQPEPEGLSYNFSGVCPDCKKDMGP